MMTDNIDPSHELYLHHGDIPGLKLVTKNLDGDNYNHWSRSMTVALKAKNKIGFVTGECKAPDEDSPYRSHWETCNNRVISWLLHAVTPEIAESESIVLLHMELHQHFGRSNAAKTIRFKLV